MRRVLLAVLLAAVVLPACASARYRTVNSTGYCGDPIAADGSAPRWGTVAAAQGYLPMHALLRVVRPRRGFNGRHYFRVTDWIGSGSLIDFYVPWGSEPTCSWGRRRVTFEVVKHRRRVAHERLRFRRARWAP